MKINATLSIGFPDATYEDVIEIDDEELEGLTEEEKKERFEEEVKEWAWNYIEIWWEEDDQKKGEGIR